MLYIECNSNNNIMTDKQIETKQHVLSDLKAEHGNVAMRKEYTILIKRFKNGCLIGATTLKSFDIVTHKSGIGNAMGSIAVDLIENSKMDGAKYWMRAIRKGDDKERALSEQTMSWYATYHGQQQQTG